MEKGWEEPSSLLLSSCPFPSRNVPLSPLLLLCGGMPPTNRRLPPLKEGIKSSSVLSVTKKTSNDSFPPPPSAFPSRGSSSKPSSD